MRSNIEFKYKLKEKLEKMPVEEYKIVMRTFPKALNISQRTFHRYIYTPVYEKYSMPVDHLARLANFLVARLRTCLIINLQPLPAKIS